MPLTERSNSGTTNFLFGVGHGHGNFVAVGGIGTILTSTNAVDWSPRNSGVSNNLFSSAYGDGTLRGGRAERADFATPGISAGCFDGR